MMKKFVLILMDFDIFFCNFKLIRVPKDLTPTPVKMKTSSRTVIPMKNLLQNRKNPLLKRPPLPKNPKANMPKAATRTNLTKWWARWKRQLQLQNLPSLRLLQRLLQSQNPRKKTSVMTTPTILKWTTHHLLLRKRYGYEVLESISRKTL